MWNGARDIIKDKAGPIKEVSVNCDLLNSAEQGKLLDISKQKNKKARAFRVTKE